MRNEIKHYILWRKALCVTFSIAWREEMFL